jgi:transposase-like protein
LPARLAVRLYVRFTLSFRDFEETLAQRGIAASYETGRWHLDEMVVKIRGLQRTDWLPTEPRSGSCAAVIDTDQAALPALLTRRLPARPCG